MVPLGPSMEEGVGPSLSGWPDSSRPAPRPAPLGPQARWEGPDFEQGLGAPGAPWALSGPTQKDGVRLWGCQVGIAL